MEYLQNLHTHTTYGDGKDSPEQMTNAAIDQGFKSIGFSEHAYLAYKNDWCMTKESQNKYIEEINKLKKTYADKIKIYCGIEFDMFSEAELTNFDYSIGSVHGFMIDDEYVEFDIDSEGVYKIINEYFGGDGMAYAKKYYETLSQLPSMGNFDIIGHFDIVTKHCEKKNYFDINSSEYLSYAIDAARALKGKINYFEINTGAISRMYRTTPYPAKPILKELNRLDFGAVITSDCHDAKMLSCKFDDAHELLKECGFKYKYILTDEGFKAEKI